MQQFEIPEVSRVGGLKSAPRTVGPALLKGSLITFVAGWERCEQILVTEITPFFLIRKGTMPVVLKPCHNSQKEYVSPFGLLKLQCLCVFLDVSGMICTFCSSA